MNCVFTVDEIIEATGGRIIKRSSGETFRGLSTDSRQISNAALYLPIIGERFDGHDFISDAIKDGALGSLVQSGLEEKIKAVSGDVTLISVNDTLEALGDIAHFWRKKFELPIIAVTGSSGKTTTKEMVAGTVGTTKRTLKNRGNFNNLVGLPLTLLEINAGHEVAIVEMGTNRRGEIARLTQIAMPDVGLITNIGPAHLEGFKSMDVVRKEKWDLFNNMGNRGTAIINNDDDSLREMAGRWKGKAVTFGIKNDADVRAEHISVHERTGTKFTLTIGGASRELTMSTTGEHNIYNALAAAASSCAVGIEHDLICEGLQSFKPISGRMEILNLKNGAFLIDDTYNANPASVGVALKTLKDLKGKQKSTLILGDMLELGTWAEEMHQDIGGLIADTGVDTIFLRGKFSHAVAEGAVRKGLKSNQIYFPETAEEIATHLRQHFKKGDWVLVKGSRNMKMEEIVQELTGVFGLEKAEG
jgi:UDP-N-acetylmuramoyl-tripeptide--D-alanyl-D-alanine ligase